MAFGSSIEQLENRILFQAASFFVQPPIGVGTNPSSIVVTDLNGDGIPDMVVANKGDVDVSVMLGNGNGTFQPPLDFGVQYYPSGVVVADFNGDGIPDLAVSNQGSNSVSILLGNGDGTFQTQQVFTVGYRPEAIAVGKLDGDSNFDIVTADAGINNVSILQGNGDGTFKTAFTIPVPNTPTSIAVAHLFNDQNADIIVTSEATHSVTILRGTGLSPTGQDLFAPPLSIPVGNDPESVAVGDLVTSGRKAGIPDIVTANLLDQTVSVLLGTPNGTFRPAVNFSVGPQSPLNTPVFVAIADLNNSGIPDIITANGGLNYTTDATVSVLIGNGDGTFGPPAIYDVGYQPTSIAVSEVYGDGLPDLLVTNGYSGTVNILQGLFASAPTIDRSGSDILVTGTYGPGTITITRDGGKIDVNDDGMVRSFNKKNVAEFIVATGPGGDSVSIGEGVRPVLVNGGTGNDTIIASNIAPDTLLGGLGADSISAADSGGNDSLNGGHGNDTLVAGSGNDQLLGGRGNDSLVAGIGASLLMGQGGNDTVLGTAAGIVDTGADTLLGGAGNDVIHDHHLAKGDSVFGGSGNDTLRIT